MRVAILKMSSFSVQGFQEKLNRLTPSQDSIETLSLWVIHHKAHGKTSAAVWQDNVEKGNYEWGSRVNNPLLRNQAARERELSVRGGFRTGSVLHCLQDGVGLMYATFTSVPLLARAHTYPTADPDRRLLLFYLANDILQNGKRKGTDVFQELFKDPLREAVILARWALTPCSNTHTHT